MKKEGNGLIMVQRKISEEGNGHCLALNSVTIHNVSVVLENGWGLLANFDDTLKLTHKGKTLKVSTIRVTTRKYSNYFNFRSYCT